MKISPRDQFYSSHLSQFIFLLIIDSASKRINFIFRRAEKANSLLLCFHFTAGIEDRIQAHSDQDLKKYICASTSSHLWTDVSQDYNAGISTDASSVTSLNPLRSVAELMVIVAIWTLNSSWSDSMFSLESKKPEGSKQPAQRKREDA